MALPTLRVGAVRKPQVSYGYGSGTSGWALSAVIEQ